MRSVAFSLPRGARALGAPKLQAAVVVAVREEPQVRVGPAEGQGGTDTPDPLTLPARGHHAGGGPWELWGDLQTQPAPALLLQTAPRPASTRETGSATSASPARAQRTWRRWRPPPTWACPGAGRSESMMPRCAWGAAAIQVRGWSERWGAETPSIPKVYNTLPHPPALGAQRSLWLTKLGVVKMQPQEQNDGNRSRTLSHWFQHKI